MILKSCLSHDLAGFIMTGYHQDLFQLDPGTSTWTDLTTKVQGTAPNPRQYAGFSYANKKLFLFGGQGLKGNFYFSELASP